MLLDGFLLVSGCDSDKKKKEQTKISNAGRYEAVLDGGLVPVAYSARQLPRRFVHHAAAAAGAEAKMKKRDGLLCCEVNHNNDGTMMQVEKKKEDNVVFWETV